MPPKDEAARQVERALGVLARLATTSPDSAVENIKGQTLQRRSLPAGLARIRELLSDLRTHQGSLDNYLDSYLACMEELERCDRVSEQLKKAERRLKRALDPDYWSDVRDALEKVHSLTRLKPVPDAADFEVLLKEFNDILARANSLLTDLPQDRKELQALPGRVSEQIANLRTAAKGIGGLYQQEVRKARLAIMLALERINEQMLAQEAQTEVPEHDTNIAHAVGMYQGPRGMSIDTSSRAPDQEVRKTTVDRLTSLSSIKRPDDGMIDQICEIMVQQASGAGPQGPSGWFRSLVRRSELPEPWKRARDNTYDNTPSDVARDLVMWLIGKGTNPNKREYSALATVLEEMLDDLGVEGREFVLSFVESHNHITNPRTVGELRERYLPKGETGGGSA